MKGDTQVAMAICFFFVGAYIGAVIERDVFPTCDGLIVGAAMGLFTGVVAGIYSGVVVTRMARFEELRNQIKRIALGFEYIFRKCTP